MSLRSRTVRLLRPMLKEHPGLKEALRSIDHAASRWHHGLASTFPQLIQPRPRQITIAVTAACNLKCVGCRYGRDFMLGKRLALSVVRDTLDDAKEAGVNRVRFYGGEPMLHPDLPEMIRHSTDLGMDTYITTNATLLGEKVDELYDAGLRWMTIGFYGVGAKYADYTQRKGHFEKLESGLRYARKKYGSELELQLNYVLLRPTTNLEALYEAWDFARRYGMFFHLDLYMHDIPFFTDGPDDELAFRREDRPAVQEVVDELVRLKQAHPSFFPQPLPFIRSVTDWLILGPEMKVPCDAYQLLWVGADGTVQLCDVTFPLGNLHEKRLAEMLFTDEHRQASRDGFLLKCTNCTCKCDSRIMKHGPSFRRYAG